MMKRTLWLLPVTLLLVGALVLASCQPAEPAEEQEGQTVTGKVTDEEQPAKEEEETAAEEEEEDEGPVMITNSAGKQQEKPQYGGELTYGGTVTFVGFDPAYVTTYKNWHLIHTHDPLLMGDWAKGQAGTGETGFKVYTFMLDYLTGYLVESYEFPDDQTIIFHLREGVHWQNKPPANGREFVADDVVFSFKRLFEIPESYLVATHREGKRPTSIEALDKHTVEIKVPKGTQGPIFRDLSAQTWPIDPDIVKTYGDHKDWTKIGGTGPFQMVDWVPESSVTYKKNPNYWMKDPLTGMQLPYIDGFTYLVIPDRSTQLAALRTGKLDQFGGIQWEEKDQLLETSPQLKWDIFGHSEAGVGMNTQNDPWGDIRVRKALALATDNESILNDYYNGNAVMLGYPVKDLPDFQSAYTPLDQMPAEVQELFTYNPDKAKELLAEAGYPNGFQTKMVVPAYSELYRDIATVLQGQWAQVGIDVELDMLEYGAFNSVAVRFKHDQIILANSLYTSSPYKAQTWGELNQARNLSRIDDPYLKEQYDKIVANFLDTEERAKVLKETVPYILKNAWYLQYPLPNTFVFWQPWLKNYYGEYCLGYTKFYASMTRFGWIDSDLKFEMTGGR